MITTLGYEELKRLHEERVARSLGRYRDLLSQAESVKAGEGKALSASEPCMVIDLPERRDPVHKLGA